MRTRTVVNVLTNWASFIIGTAITFVLSPIVVHSLGDARYGVWGVIGSIVGYLGLLDLGVRVGVTRFIARYDATGDQAAVNRVVTTAFGMFAAAGALAVVLGIQLSLVLPRLVNIPADLVREGSIAVAIGGVTVAVALLGGVFGGGIAGLQRFAMLNTIDLSTEVVRAFAIVLALRAGGGLIELSLIQLGAVTTRGLLYFAANRRLQPGLRLSRALWDTAILRDIFRFSSYTMILHVSAMVIFSSDAVVIAALMPVAQVTFFVIAANLSQAAVQVLGGVTRALYPLVSARQATDGTRGATRLVRDSVRLTTIVMLPIVITFLLRGPTFIRLWMGPAYGGPSGQVLQILAAGLCVYASYQVFTVTIMALDLHRGLIVPFALEALVNLGISIVLGMWMGVTGVAWGTTLPRAAMALGFAPWFGRRKLGLGVWEYSVHAWVRPLACMVPFAAASMIVDRFWPARGLVVFFAQVALVLPVAVLGAWLIGLEHPERSKIRDGLRDAWVGLRLVPRAGVGGA